MRLACASRTSRRSRLVLVATDTGGATARPGQAARRSRLSSRALTQTVSDSRRVSDLDLSSLVRVVSFALFALYGRAELLRFLQQYFYD